ncbi:hypothetical protein PAHAL_2G012900 [Panicum hallii]|uniref:F-box domain-containing protein n=1 Tax=Panicum hallii TaxID=206008 RepID=A0A2T8KME8_9POAL|nr:hypothetical protein PAHAL_2G012900 [Panicum hallii]
MAPLAETHLKFSTRPHLLLSSAPRISLSPIQQPNELHPLHSAAPPSSRTAPALLDDLTEEIFLRIHLADAATLVRATLVCRRWCRLIAAPGFRRRFREFHRAPHMLGFSCNIDLGRYVVDDLGSFYGRPSTVARFVRTSFCLKRVDMESSRMVDTRHGRVLLHRASDWGNNYLFVWDPITKEGRNCPRSCPSGTRTAGTRPCSAPPPGATTWTATANPSPCSSWPQATQGFSTSCTHRRLSPVPLWGMNSTSCSRQRPKS